MADEHKRLQNRAKARQMAAKVANKVMAPQAVPGEEKVRRAEKLTPYPRVVQEAKSQSRKEQGG